MQQTRTNLGHRKHRKAFGKGPINKTVGMLIERELNKASDELAKVQKDRKPKMYDSVADAFKNK